LFQLPCVAGVSFLKNADVNREALIMSEAKNQETIEQESIQAEDEKAALTYQEKVLDNYKTNLPIGISHGITHYAAMGFYYQSTVLSKFIFDLSGSSALSRCIQLLRIAGTSATAAVWQCIWLSICHLRREC
jgi:hypothetical protein